MQLRDIYERLFVNVKYPWWNSRGLHLHNPRPYEFQVPVTQFANLNFPAQMYRFYEFDEAVKVGIVKASDFCSCHRGRVYFKIPGGWIDYDGTLQRGEVPDDHYKS